MARTARERLRLVVVGDAAAADREVAGLIDALEAGRLPDRLTVSALFAPTGPIQELSLRSGWAYEFLALAERFDAAARAVYAGPTPGRIL